MSRRRNFFHKTQHKRYATRRFHNPYFRTDQQRTRPVVIGFFVCGIFVLVGLLLFFFLHPIFRLKTINVSGLDHLSQEEVEKEIRAYFSSPVGLIFTRQNRFLFRPTTFVRTLKEALTLNAVHVIRQQDRVIVELIERTSHLLWKTSESVYVVDLDGVIVRSATPDDAYLPLFIDRQNVRVSMGQSVLAAEEIVSVFLFHKHLASMNTAIVQTEFDRLEGKWAAVLTKEGYRILFDASGDIDSQASRLEVVKREKMKDVTNLQYIDLRFGDHVYFK